MTPAVCPCCGAPVPAGMWLTAKEAATLTRTGSSTWRNGAAAGRFPGAVKKGHQWLIPRTALAAAPASRPHPPLRQPRAAPHA